MAKPIRRHPTSGLYNCRDLGGYPTSGGGMTRYGVFFRSELPGVFGDPRLDYFKDTLGVTLTLDFRSSFEAERMPSALRDADFLRYVWAPLFNEAAMGGGGAKQPPRAERGHLSWGEEYVRMAEESKPWAKTVLTELAQNEGAGHYHCTTGKDRTGICSALLLGVAGVADEDIIADYCVSEVYLRPVYAMMQHMLPGMEPDESYSQPFFSTSHNNMRALLTHLNDGYGGVEGYVRDAGAGSDLIAALRAKLLEGAGK